MIRFLNVFIMILRRLGLLPPLTIMVLSLPSDYPPSESIESQLSDTVRPPPYPHVERPLKEKRITYYPGLLYTSGVHRIELEDE
jgi:hypothetical protein